MFKVGDRVRCINVDRIDHFIPNEDKVTLNKCYIVRAVDSVCISIVDDKGENGSYKLQRFRKEARVRDLPG